MEGKLYQGTWLPCPALSVSHSTFDQHAEAKLVEMTQRGCLLYWSGVFTEHDTSLDTACTTRLASVPFGDDHHGVPLIKRGNCAADERSA